MFRHILSALAVIGLPAIAPCEAQGLARVSFDFNLGAGVVGSSAPHGRIVGLAVDGVLGLRPGAHTLGGFLVVAMSGSGQAFGVYSESCDAVPGGDCRSDLPPFW